MVSIVSKNTDKRFINLIQRVLLEMQMLQKHLVHTSCSDGRLNPMRSYSQINGDPPLRDRISRP